MTQPQQSQPSATSSRAARRLALFGSVDGLTMFLGLVLGLVVSRQSNAAAWHAALGGAMGELVGMATGQYMSDRAAGLKPALACGLAGAAACALPGLPYIMLSSRLAAGLAAGAIAMAVAGVVAWQRPERGWAAVLTTYGVLAGAGLLSGLTGLL